MAGLAARRGAAFGVRDGIGQQCRGPLGRPGGSEPVGRLGSSGSGHNARRDTRARWGLVLRESAENRTSAGGPASGQGGPDDASPTAAGPDGSKFRDRRILWCDASLGDGVRATTSGTGFGGWVVRPGQCREPVSRPALQHEAVASHALHSGRRSRDWRAARTAWRVPPSGAGGFAYRAGDSGPLGAQHHLGVRPRWAGRAHAGPDVDQLGQRGWGRVKCFLRRPLG